MTARYIRFVLLAALLAAVRSASAEMTLGYDPNDVSFLSGGGVGTEEGRYRLAVGLTFGGWSFPTERSTVSALRLNFGWSRYAHTQGVDLGLWSDSETFAGCALNIVANEVEREASGVQIALANYVRGTACGLQLGIVNVAERLNGVQIGLMNLNRAGRTWPFVNWSF